MTREEAAREALEIAKSMGCKEGAASSISEATLDGLKNECYVRAGELTGSYIASLQNTFEECIAELREKAKTKGPAARLEKLRAEVAELEKIVDPRD